MTHFSTTHPSTLCRPSACAARRAVAALLLVWPLASAAVADEAGGGVAAYYQPADGKGGQALKSALCAIVYNRTEMRYDELWTAFKTTDMRSDGTLWDIYSNITSYTPDAPHGNSAEGSGINREHSFPKSWFGGEVMPMFTDLHHIYPVDGNINARRSNYPYGETGGETYTSANAYSRLGACTCDGYGGRVFEPADEYKGDLARTYFYMVTCYEEKLPYWYASYGGTEVAVVLDGNTYPGLAAWQLQMLMRWAQDDPVSQKEKSRNEAVCDLQHNRNPFIDYPGLEEYVWGSLSDKAFSSGHYLLPARLRFGQAEATAVAGERLSSPVLTTVPTGLAVSYSSSDETVATVDAATGEVSATGNGIALITATFAGNDSYNSATATYRLTVGPPPLAYGQTLLYEGLSKYAGSDGTNALSTAYAHLDYGKWSTLTKVFAGGSANAHAKGGCLKLGSAGEAGVMAASGIALEGRATLTFYLKQYGSDGGKLSVSVSGADADATLFTPTTEWTLCTVGLTGAEGTVDICLSTTTKRAYVDEITLTTNGSLNLAADGSNAIAIAEAATHGGTFDVTLTGRTLYKDGTWNTLCLPFGLDEAQMAGSVLAGADIRTLSTASFSEGTLTLNFTPPAGEGAVSAISAGTPYLVRWGNGQDEGPAQATEHTGDPLFRDVSIDNAHSDKYADLGGGYGVSFCGTDSRTAYGFADDTVLLLGRHNTLHYPQGGTTIGAQQAYFKLTGGITAADTTDGIRTFRLNFGEDEAAIAEATTTAPDGYWHDLSGRTLRGKPAKKGLYIRNGKKMAIH